MIRAVLWDFGGVILSSPFEAFNRYEAANGLPTDFIRSVNATDPDSNAWALLERNDIAPEEFDALFADESEALGHRIPGADVLGLLSGEIRPEMVTALDRVIRAGYRTACLTNNVVGGEQRMEVGDVMVMFDHVVESSKVGCRKPERALLRDRLRAARRRAERVRVPRRPRHQPQAGQGDGHDDHQGRRRRPRDRRTRTGPRHLPALSLRRDLSADHRSSAQFTVHTIITRPSDEFHATVRAKTHHFVVLRRDRFVRSQGAHDRRCLRATRE